MANNLDKKVSIEAENTNITKYVMEAAAEWMSANPEAKVRQETLKKLDEFRDKILLTLLGFSRSSWNDNLEVDHCNGRAGESAVGDYMKKVKQQAIQEWLESVELPKVTPKIAQALKKDLDEAYGYELRSRLHQKIKEAAKEDADRIIATFTNTKAIDDFIACLLYTSDAADE